MTKTTVIFAGVVLAVTIGQAQTVSTASVTNSVPSTAVAPSVSAGTSSVTMEAAKPAAKKWGVSLVEQISQSLQTAKDKGGALSYTQLSVNYKFNDDWKAGALAGVNTTIAGKGEEQSYEATYTDLALTAATKAPTFIPNADPAYLGLRVYLPTSATSIKNKQQAYLRADYSVNTPSAGKWSAEALVSGRMALKQDTPDTGMIIVQPAARYSFNDSISTYGSLVYILSAKNDNMIKRTSEMAGPEVGLDMSFAKMDLSVAISQAVEIHNGGQPEYVLFDTDNTVYSLTGVVRF